MDFYIEFQRQNFRRVKPLSITDFRFISQIGQGGYGVVYLMATKSGEILAVKKMDKKMLFLQDTQHITAKPAPSPPSGENQLCSRWTTPLVRPCRV